MLLKFFERDGRGERLDEIILTQADFLLDRAFQGLFLFLREAKKFDILHDPADHPVQDATEIIRDIKVRDVTEIFF